MRFFNMDDTTLALIVAQAVVFVLLIVSECLGVSPQIPYNAVIQMAGFFRPKEEPPQKTIVELRKQQIE